MPSSSPYSISAGVLLLPWKKILSGGKPATLATWYSPPEETSMDNPSSETSCAYGAAAEGLARVDDLDIVQVRAKGVM